MPTAYAQRAADMNKARVAKGGRGLGQRVRGDGRRAGS
jgi:hypothetical protein